MTTTTPARSADQRLVALATANQIRSERAAQKRRWRELAGDALVEDVCQLIASPPRWASTWKLAEVLLALPKVGGAKTFKWLKAAGISQGRSLGGLSARQRDAIARTLRGWGAS